jgi:hypothetical protein
MRLHPVTWLGEACDHERSYGAQMEHWMLRPTGFGHHRVGRLRSHLRSRSQAEVLVITLPTIIGLAVRKLPMSTAAR